MKLSTRPMLTLFFVLAMISLKKVSAQETQDTLNANDAYITAVDSVDVDSMRLGNDAMNLADSVGVRIGKFVNEGDLRNFYLENKRLYVEILKRSSEPFTLEISRTDTTDSGVEYDTTRQIQRIEVPYENLISLYQEGIEEPIITTDIARYLLSQMYDRIPEFVESDYEFENYDDVRLNFIRRVSLILNDTHAETFGDPNHRLRNNDGKKLGITVGLMLSDDGKYLQIFLDGMTMNGYYGSGSLEKPITRFVLLGTKIED